ncbi:MAG: nucleotidyltransferase family protein [Thalassotalea sp.]
MQPLGIVVLAAGRSSRLGQNKQLISINGQALIAHQCQQLSALKAPIFCVLGYQKALVVQALQAFPQINIIENKHWAAGLGGSIALATKQLSNRFERLLFVLGDQWQLSGDNINAFIEASNQSELTISMATNNAKNMHRLVIENIQMAELSPPVIFDKRYYHELSLLQGEQGAKAVLSAHKSQLNPIYFPEAFVDLDTPEQLNKLRDVYPQ